ncbi:MAG TPA: ABC transporter transmembrane domain-containing protein, partial [Puia sp.]|nr:ABC transporter transmembrane domain-containing protein [Puia sp.]
MKTFFRVLSYSTQLGFQLTFFFIYSVLGIIFGTFNIVLVIPMLKTLFNQQAEAAAVPGLPSFEFSADYLIGVFNHYYLSIIESKGAVNALLFVCVLIIITVLLANLFRYLERVMATKIRVDLVKNIRMEIFRSITQMHIGFFNNERKGDLISRFTNDVSEVEQNVINSLKSILKEPITI